MRLHWFVATLLLGLATAGIADAQKPLKVYILVGQSNMQGHAQIRTFEHVGMDPDTAPILQQMQRADGTPRVCDDVWISYLSSGGEKRGRMSVGFGADENKIGPEFTFGISMQAIVDQPILIIKTAWGGKSLHTDFRPPGAGPYQFNKTQIDQFKNQAQDFNAIQAERAQATGRYFRQSLDHVKRVLSDIRRVYPDYDPQQGHELAGFVWFQGWNDMVDRGVYPNRDQPGGYDQYSRVLAHLIRDVRKELAAPELPFVIGVLGVGGPVAQYTPEQQRYAAVHQNFRDAMAAAANLPEFEKNVAVVLTEKYWDPELTALKGRDSKIKQKIKQLRSAGKLGPEEEKQALIEMRQQEMTVEEIVALTSGISNAEYHYLGSAKIMAQIGNGFAVAIDSLSKNQAR